MKTFCNVKVFMICAALICGIALVSFIAIKKAKERRLAEHASTVRAQAEKGDPWAETELGHLYYRGLGVAQDYTQAVNWFRKAADKGDARAQYDLGYMYWYGQGVSQDRTEGFRWSLKAAEQGNVSAEYAVGSSLYNGIGVQQDRAAAAVWYRKAADQGFAQAQYDLGYMYYYGQGVPQDRTEANLLLHRAADQGNENAQSTLGIRRGSLNLWRKIFIIVNLTGGVLLLAGSIRHGPRVQNRIRRGTALAGFLVLAFGGLDLFRNFGNSIPLYSSADTAVLFARDLLGGVSLAMLFDIVLTRTRAKYVPIISCALFLAYCLSVLAAQGLLLCAPGIRVFLNGFAWFIGMVVTSTILLRLERRSGGGEQNGGGGLAAIE